MTKRADVRVALIAGTLGILFWLTIGSYVIRDAFQRDFLNLYTGGLLARTGHLSELYNWELQKATQDSLVPNLQLHFPFVRPPFYALMLAPISLLPVKTAFVVWIALWISALVGVSIWAWRRFGPDSLIFCSFFLPASSGIAHGQDCMILLLEMLAAWLLLERRKDRLAGLVLSLTLFKFHLLLLLPLAILLRRRWNLFAGYAAGGTALALLSLAVSGIAGARGYVELITRRDLETLSPSPWMMVGWNAIAVNLGLGGTWFVPLLLAAGAALVIFSALRAREDYRWFWTAVVGSMMLSPHTYQYDLSSILIPGLIGAFVIPDRYLRIAAGIALIPLPYFFSVAGIPVAIVPSLVVAAFVVSLSGLLPVKEPVVSAPRIRSQVPA